MRTSNTFGIQFIIRQDKVRDSKAPLYARLTVNKEIVHFALKQWVNPEQWDNRRGAGKGKAESIKELNNLLDQVRLALSNSYQTLLVSGKTVTAESVKNLFMGIDEEAPVTLSHLFWYHSEQSRHTLAASTLKHYQVTQRYLERFISHNFRKKDIELQQINYKFIMDFDYFLRSYKPADHQKAIHNNGVMKHMVRFQKMTNLAIRLEWMKSDPFKNYKIKLNKVDKAFLNQAELKRIEDKKLSVARLEMVRDIFVFCCYTGLSYIDVANLTDQHIVKGYDEEYWIKTHRQKTQVTVNTPILPQAMKIIAKYMNHDRTINRPNVFPVFSNQKTNAYLKEIADLCGILKQLTFHVARHTFATTVTLSNGVPIETVSKMLGHSKIATTQIYARVLEKKIGEDMAVLRGKLAKGS